MCCTWDCVIPCGPFDLVDRQNRLASLSRIFTNRAMMKYLQVSCALLLTLGSMSLGRPQLSDTGAASKATTERTTTAVPKDGNFIKTSSPSISSTTMTTMKTIENKVTTLMHHETSSNVFISPHDRSSTMNLHHSTTHTTTAMPHLDTSSPGTPRCQFNLLSFMGGSLFTVCLLGLALISWKMYKIHVERNYRTI